MPQFTVQIRAVGQRLRNFLAIDFPESFSQPMHRHARRTFIRAKFCRDFRIVDRSASDHETIFERIKIIGSVCRREFFPQPVHRQVKQRQRPLAVESFFRRERTGVGGEAAFSEGCVELNVGLRAAALLRRGTPPLFAHEILQRNDEERPQLAFIAVGRIKPAFFKETAEKFLREVLRVMRRLPTPTDISVKRMPVGLANDFQRRCGFGRLPLRRRQHNRPARVRKNTRSIAGRNMAAHADIISRVITGNEAVVTEQVSKCR
jgi:hypothetical protein